MLVDNVLHQPSPPLKPTDLADFVNLDLFASQSSATSDSRDPSPSVSTPLFSPLPLISEPNPSDWFNFSLDDDFVKPDPHVPPPVTAVPWDFLSFPNDHTDSGGINPSTDISPTFAIDPQLMSSPAPPKPPQPVHEMKNNAEEKHEEEDVEEEVTSPTIKVGGKGKSRKGTVHSGGVQKKATISAVVRDQDDPREDGDDWRPSPEEYKKMSSKEKRQLRNKISARNFRVRRKEYITTLEGDIAERDRLIDAIRCELGSSQSENVALRQEISALKKTLLASANRAESPVLPPPGPIPALAPAVRAGTSSSFVTPNTQKDLPSSPRLAASPSNAFWGGSASFGGITPVHTTLIPENFIHPLAGVKSFTVAPAHSPTSKENINPSLNSGKSSLFSNANKVGRFDTFAEANPFVMKALDAYWMQLWSRLAQIQPTQSQQLPPFANGSLTGHRPHHFTPPRVLASSCISTFLSGKHTPAYPTPPTSPDHRSAIAPLPSPTETFTPQQALLATMISETLLQRLGSAFWQAFAMDETTSHAPTWDADKIRCILEGKAVIKIVDVEPEDQVGATPATSIPTLSNSLETRECTKDSGVTAILEDGIRALSSGKK